MSIRPVYTFLSVAALSCTAVVLTQAAQTSTAAAVDKIEEQPITLRGCLVRESDYRKMHDSGRGGFLGTGAGLNDEYVLINASRAVEISSSTTPLDCTNDIGADAYELSGKGERDLAEFVGREVEVHGELKEAKLDDEPRPIGTAGTIAPRPEGGFDPLGQDLKLREVNVMSIRTIGPAAFASSEPARAAEEPKPVATSGIAEADEPSPEPADQVEQPSTLPRTASPFLPWTGPLGLLSIAGALVTRIYRT